jgi:predicted lipoprotein with Yx(FWY)xxD motif
VKSAVTTSLGPSADGDGYGSAAGSGSTDGATNGGYGSTGSGAASTGVLERALKTKWTTTIGTIVVDDKNWTMYRFDKDTASPAKSNCNGGCAATWPPALWRDNLALTGVNRAAVGKVRRDDGSWQVTLGGWPIYRYAKDMPGTWRGQGVGGVWHAISPTGKKAVKCKPTMGAGATGTVRLGVMRKKGVGAVVAENGSWAVYRFDLDRKNWSSCYGTCEKAWPVVRPGATYRLQGIDRSKLGKIKRKDGSWQLTLGGWPMYRYAMDRAGTLRGEGRANVWWAMRADGSRAFGPVQTGSEATYGSQSYSSSSGHGSTGRSGGGHGSSDGGSSGGYSSGY